MNRKDIDNTAYTSSMHGVDTAECDCVVSCAVQSIQRRSVSTYNDTFTDRHPPPHIYFYFITLISSIFLNKSKATHAK